MKRITVALYRRATLTILELLLYFVIYIAVLTEFCRISIEFILNGPNSKIYHNAAQKLGTDVSIVQHGVEGLMNLFTEGAKHLLNEQDFNETLLTVEFSDSARNEILGHYQKNVTEIRAVLARMVTDVPQYKSLEWRCDVQVASRSLRHQVIPLITMKLVTEVNGEEKPLLLQTDPTNLVHLTDVLDQALRDVKSQHCRRIQRQIK